MKADCDTDATVCPLCLVPDGGLLRQSLLRRSLTPPNSASTAGFCLLRKP